jgi:hypothetical protein
MKKLNKNVKVLDKNVLNLKNVVVFFEGDWNENSCCVFGENWVEELERFYEIDDCKFVIEKCENGWIGGYDDEDCEFYCFIFDLNEKGCFKFNDEKGCFLVENGVVDLFDDVEYEVECDVEVLCDLDEKIILIK